MAGNALITLVALLIYFTTFFTGVKDNKGINNVNNPSGSFTSGSSVSAPKYGYISSVSAQLRSSTKNASILGTLPQGTGVQIIGASGEWYNVKTPSDQTGWVAKWLVKVGNPSSVRVGGKEVAVYYSETSKNDTGSLNSLKINANQINTLVPFYFQINQNGQITDNHKETPVKFARGRGIKTLALVHNIQGSLFSGNTAHKLLTSSQNRRNAVDNIVKILTRYGYNGVNIDFENIKAADRWAFTQFIAELSAKLHSKGFLVTASVPAKTFDNKNDGWSGAYDYAALGRYLDQVMIMTYDQHTASGAAGPVASYTWVRKVIQYAVSVIPRSKILMGIAAYGYDWPKWGKGKALTFSQIESLTRNLKIMPLWDSAARVPYFSYWKNGVSHKVYYENNQSLKAKINIVNEFNIKGIAIWRLGVEDPLYWTVIGQYL